MPYVKAESETKHHHHHREGRFLFYKVDGRVPVDIESVLHEYGAYVVNVLADDMVVAVVTGDILDRVESDHPGIAFEEDVRLDFAAFPR